MKRVLLSALLSLPSFCSYAADLVIRLDSDSSLYEPITFVARNTAQGGHITYISENQDIRVTGLVLKETDDEIIVELIIEIQKNDKYMRVSNAVMHMKKGGSVRLTITQKPNPENTTTDLPKIIIDMSELTQTENN